MASQAQAYRRYEPYYRAEPTRFQRRRSLQERYDTLVSRNQPWPASPLTRYSLAVNGYVRDKNRFRCDCCGEPISYKNTTRLKDSSGWDHAVRHSRTCSFSPRQLSCELCDRVLSNRYEWTVHHKDCHVEDVTSTGDRDGTYSPLGGRYEPRCSPRAMSTPMTDQRILRPGLDTPFRANDTAALRRNTPGSVFESMPAEPRFEANATELTHGRLEHHDQATFARASPNRAVSFSASQFAPTPRPASISPSAEQLPELTVMAYFNSLQKSVYLARVDHGSSATDTPRRTAREVMSMIRNGNTLEDRQNGPYSAVDMTVVSRMTTDEYQSLADYVEVIKVMLGQAPTRA